MRPFPLGAAAERLSSVPGAACRAAALSFRAAAASNNYLNCRLGAVRDDPHGALSPVGLHVVLGPGWLVSNVSN
ncbi:unnamed protein product [Boreogadus saida]